jgi:hypothetical protein
MFKLMNEDHLKKLPVNNLPSHLKREFIFILTSQKDESDIRIKRISSDSGEHWAIGFFKKEESEPCVMKWVPIGLDYGVIKIKIGDNFDHWVGVRGKGENISESSQRILCTDDCTINSLWQIKIIKNSFSFGLRNPNFGGFLCKRSGGIGLYAGLSGNAIWLASNANNT